MDTTPRLLRTKLLIPQTHPEVVLRPRLLAELDRCLGSQLTLVSASAGFGKTTLLSMWVASRGLEAAWVSLDERDSDGTRFWSYVIAALQTLRPEVGLTSSAMLQTPQPPPIEGVLTELINDVADLDGQFVLILDDYHVIDDAAIHRAVAFLVDHLPPQLRLILSSRADPPLPLALLRARRGLLELRSPDLRFTSDEAGTLFNEVMGLALEAEDVAALEDLIEGWAAGLQLAALSLQEVGDVDALVASFSGSHRYVFDYLAHEIFDRQPIARQSFLLRTAHLERLSAALCEAVTGCDESQAMLQDLDRANLFIVPLDRERHWYRYHHLFADFLRALVHDRVSSDKIADLHRRASRWYGEREAYHEAIHHAFAAQDTDLAKALVTQAAEAQFIHNELRTFLGWLDALPQREVLQDPYLSMAGGWAALALGQNEVADGYVTAVEGLLRSLETERDVGRDFEVDGGLAEVAIIRASLAFNRMDLAGAKARCVEAQAVLDQGKGGVFNDHQSLMGIVAFDLALASEFRGETDVAVGAFETANVLLRQDANSQLLPMSISHLAQLQMQQGHLRAAAATYDAAIASVNVGPARSPLGGLAFAGMGTLLYEWNDLERAGSYLSQGLELGRRWSEWEILMTGYGGLIRIALARGQVSRASEILVSCRIEAERAQMSWAQPLVEGLSVLMALDADELAIAREWASGLEHLSAGPVPYLLEVQALLLARVHWALGHPQRCTDLIVRLLPTARDGGRQGRVIEALVIQAGALEALGDRQAAVEALTEALVLAEPEGYVRVFVDEGAPLAPLLRAVDVVPAYVARLLGVIEGEASTAALAAFTPDEAPSRSPDTRAEPAGEAVTECSAAACSQFPREALSDREREVLALLAEGLTNQAIADRLYISINTVKTHARHIYEKLEVRNRAQAARLATERHLLD